MTFKVIETFSGIGSQAKALYNIKKRNPSFNYKIEATVEWELSAIIAYNIIHKDSLFIEDINNMSKQELIEKLSVYNLSSDGKTPITYSALSKISLIYLQALYSSIINNNNLVDISTVCAADLPESHLLTYSFPCQDLSISSYWHRNFTGINRNANNSSSLLWEIERILFEYVELNKPLPRFLLMENVTAIQGPMHKENFNLWKNQLEKIGYTNYVYTLNSNNFGIPQSRKRTFMISIKTKDLNKKTILELDKHFSIEKLENIKIDSNLEDFLRLDYNNSVYYQEALESVPNWTDSRKKIYESAKPALAKGQVVEKDAIAKTITTKQDRNPTAGVILHKMDLPKTKAIYRNLTPRETFLLMGFDESDFQKIIDNNFNVTKSRKILSHSKLLKLAGNSIVVNILEYIFQLMIDSTTLIENNKEKTEMIT